MFWLKTRCEVWTCILAAGHDRDLVLSGAENEGQTGRDRGAVGSLREALCAACWAGPGGGCPHGLAVSSMLQHLSPAEGRGLSTGPLREVAVKFPLRKKPTVRVYPEELATPSAASRRKDSASPQEGPHCPPHFTATFRRSWLTGSQRQWQPNLKTGAHSASLTDAATGCWLCRPDAPVLWPPSAS